MNVENYISLSRALSDNERGNEVRREKTAEAFEELFARHLVREMTRGAFTMEGISNVESSHSLYKEFITDALSQELAAQRKLGMADMVMKYWDEFPEEITTNEDIQIPGDTGIQLESGAKPFSITESHD